MKIPFTIAFLCLSFSFFSQKKVLDHTVYNSWKKNEHQLISNNGRFVSYEINPHRGDGYLYVYDIQTAKMDSFARGKDAAFSCNSDFLAFKITPGFDTLRSCELQKIDKKKWPKDTLAIYLPEKDSLIKIPLLKSFVIGEENNWLTYLKDDNTLASPTEKTSKKHVKKRKKNKIEKPKSDGNILTIMNPIRGQALEYSNVTDYTLSKKGNYVALVTHQKVKADSFRIVLVQPEIQQKVELQLAYTSIKNPTFDEREKWLVFHSSSDTNKLKRYTLNLLNIEKNKLNLEIIGDTSSDFFSKDQSVSENRKPVFTEDGRFLYFGVAKTPEQEPKDTLLESEKVKLDLWHYQDKRLQSQQLVELKEDVKRSDVYVYHLTNGTILKLSDDTLTFKPNSKQTGDYVLATSGEAYAIESQWEMPNREDYYRISTLSGNVALLKKGVGYDGKLSPSGNLFTYFDVSKESYVLLNPDNQSEQCMTCGLKDVAWQTDNNGMPMQPEPYGVTGFTRGEKEVLIQSRYDVWSYNMKEQRLTCLTKQVGETNKIRLTLKKWSADSVYYDLSTSYIEGFDERTKGTHIYTIHRIGDSVVINPIYYSDHKLSFMERSKNTRTIMFRKMSVKEYPEVRFTNNLFQSETTISVTNPQQQLYNWATVELVKWKSYDGTLLEGLVYKPEDFDASKKYPLLIYYYELNSDQLHNHHVPKPTASIIYPTEYASAGYLVFIPDIRYKIGHPAQSAYNCIMSGTDFLLEQIPNIDSTRMGLQGQSWGGYQTAQLITMTNRYTAAMAGAPVANMFSAYGGIRWGSGLNRQFQYERTQSRIGKTIWEAPELYIENSPLFHLPNVRTPLLIMANDKDGSVPWYQGIEFYTGMRRLGKPCWMLNYNGDDHNLLQNANRMDLSIRMRQFFDHYLKGDKIPEWMQTGIPAIDKGKKSGYE
jgi:dipeptidyl aminopeptidase/acylaminoacyl peptidase